MVRWSAIRPCKFEIGIRHARSPWLHTRHPGIQREAGSATCQLQWLDCCWKGDVQLLDLLKMNFKKKTKSTTESIGNRCCFVETPSANPSPLGLHQAWLYIPGESRSNGSGHRKKHRQIKGQHM